MGTSKSAFNSEVEAIKVALEHLDICPSFSKQRQVVIFSDSQAAILAIANCLEATSTMSTAHCRSLTRKMRNKCKPIVLQWLSSHCGIPGNEKGDELARRAVLLIRPHTILLALDQSHQELTICLEQLT